MAVFVVDASVALAWCFEDEKTDWSEDFLERLRRGDRINVPAHWAAEVADGLLMAARSKRIKPDQSQLLLDQLARLPIDTEPALTFQPVVRGKEVLALAEKHGLTVYDAGYLELARRYQLPLATLDGDLRKAAPAEGVPLP
jgi:predicted nucleic acid-binding protein